MTTYTKFMAQVYLCTVFQNLELLALQNFWREAPKNFCVFSWSEDDFLRSRPGTIGTTFLNNCEMNLTIFSFFIFICVRRFKTWNYWHYFYLRTFREYKSFFLDSKLGTIGTTVLILIVRIFSSYNNGVWDLNLK